ncbi:MAG TPA: ATP-binding protein [Ilumatobacter sp.]|nr:ATP-binding protein [Ilumatobacter sp.]
MTITKANARPSKDFFVSMLTRDISLEDCILDLIDNSIDAAWKASGERPRTLVVDSALADYEVTIAMSEDAFTIEDNCTGITLDDAANYAFTFGRARGDDPDDYSVGVYGIGMKRAIFKLGSEIEIHSTYAEDDVLTAFKVPIDVPEWLRSDLDPADGSDFAPSWDFDIEEDDPSPHVGVRIHVSQLHPQTQALFGDESYERSLRRILARDYMLPLMRGLRIVLNGTLVEGSTVELKENESFAPMRVKYDDDGVEIEIVAGMLFQPPDDNEPDERKDTLSGWYVACNGRIMLAADRTALTGWGDLTPMWHRQYAGFIGFVFFSAENPLLLPMTTTKRNVDSSSAVYRRARSRMYEPTRAWIDYTNARKNDLQGLKQLETSTTGTSIANVPERPAVSLPTVTKKAATEPVANINYAVPRKQLRALAAAFGDKNMTYRDVGSQSFKYAYDELVDEEDS